MILEVEEKGRSRGWAAGVLVSLHGWLAIYRQNLKERPRLTNAVVSYILSATGDFIAQTAECLRDVGHHSGGFDFRRNVSLAICSSLWNGIVLCFWLTQLERLMPRKSLRTILAKLAASQGLLNGLVYVPYFYLLHGSLMGQSLGEAYGRLTKEHFEMLSRLWAIFVPSYFVMFAIIPIDYQVLWISAVSLLWNIILSLFAHRKPAVEGIVSLIMDLDEFGGEPFPAIGQVISSMNPFGDGE